VDVGGERGEEMRREKGRKESFGLNFE